jgi:N,N'-diacetyllegionaminate synthase
VPKIYVVAEAAQGYEGREDLCLLLVRGAAAAGADAIKFQVVYRDDLCTADYRYAGLFEQLEMPSEAWGRVRRAAGERGLDFVVDVFGPRSLEVAATIGVDGVKLHSTTFFDADFNAAALRLGVRRTLISVGGVEPAEIAEFVSAHGLSGRPDVTVMYGFQAEPTAAAQNNLARIDAMRRISGLDVGFMDHADGSGPDSAALSAMALALGVTVFEKHITLDRELQLEDHVSALPPAGFRDYTAQLRRLATALGDPSLELSDDERAYRGRALKRVVASADLAEGTILAPGHLVLLRPGSDGGFLDPRDAVGRRLVRAVGRHRIVRAEDLA